jgi:tetratricopeptide (TPR) repeat protein
MTIPSALAEARLAVERREWQTALDVLAGCADGAPSVEALELKAQAAYANGEFETAVAAWEDLHDFFVAERDDIEAARAAAMVAMYLMMDTGLMAPVRGWLKRAERLIEGHDEAPAHALIAMVRTYERFMCGDMDAAGTQSALAIELGNRFGVAPAVVIGRVAAARIKIFAGQVEEGLALLDEVGALLMSGEIDPLTTGMMYCELICAAQGLAMYDMANEWTDVMERWRHDCAFGGINGRCRVHRAEMLRMSGPCDAAEEEALRACDELRPWMRREFGWPLTELGNIRLRRGDLDGAEEAYIAAHEHAWSPQPGLALLRLAQGDVNSATALIHDAIAHPFQTPSKERPPFGDLRLAPLLDAQVEIASAAGDINTSRMSTDALQAIADAYRSPSLGACAALSCARTALLEGDLEQAVDKATEAVMTWADLGAPYETSVARMVLADAHQRSGNTRAAQMERHAAKTAFEVFGALPAAERAASLAEGAAAVEEPRRAARSATFSCQSDIRTVVFAGETVSMRDLKGFRYIERLLADPNREFHVLDLVAVEKGTLPTAQAAEQSLGSESNVGDRALPVLDNEARRAYRRRLMEVDEDIEEATSMNDRGRIELAQRDRDYLIAELSRAVGLSGRHRFVGGSSERARTAVTRSLRYALARLAEHHPTLAAHLKQSVHTGTYCSYAPDPLTDIDWRI